MITKLMNIITITLVNLMKAKMRQISFVRDNENRCWLIDATVYIRFILTLSLLFEISSNLTSKPHLSLYKMGEYVNYEEYFKLLLQNA